MSKAFKKESDDDDSLELDLEPDTETEPGYKNYITPHGLKKLRAEYNKLFHEERPKLVEVIAWAASNGDRSENGDYIYGKRRLREIDRRLKFLGKRMASAEEVLPSSQPKDRVLFGARVTVEDEGGKKMVYRIVGEDEIDIEKRHISWVSPVAKALMGAKVGDSVIVHRPNGEAELSIVKIDYPDDI